VSIGTKKKLPGKKKWRILFTDKRIPVLYARILHQFCLEAAHGEEDACHEAVRRMAYAQRMLEAFGRELEGYVGEGKDFRSKVFTPVLARQLLGLPDNFAPPLHRYMASHSGEVTIEDATAFYLGLDLLNPVCIPTYRRNLIYIREATWHLRVLLGDIVVGSSKHFKQTLEFQYDIMEALEEATGEVTTIPPFIYTEIKTIIRMDLTDYFADELCNSVRADVPAPTTSH